MAKLSAERDTVLAVPFIRNWKFCPVCKADRRVTELTRGYKFCPVCGQRLRLITDKAEWQQIVRDAQKIPDVMDTEIVTTEMDLTGGYEYRVRIINGVFIDRMKAWNDKNAQIEGQMSLF